MRTILGLVALGCALGTCGCSTAADDFSPNTIINLEKTALDRWGKGDPGGYLEIMAPSVSYFDPTTERRVDGHDALAAFVAPFAGQIHIDRAEFINPVVDRHGDIAILTFNLIDHGGRLGDGPKSDARWNSTEIYQRIDGRWKIIHTHWSFTTPQLK